MLSHQEAPSIVRAPLSELTAFAVRRRVAFRIVQRHHRAHKDEYNLPFSRIIALAYDSRTDGTAHCLYPELISLAKALMCGYTSLQWRDELVFDDYDRAVHKRRFRLPNEKTQRR